MHHPTASTVETRISEVEHEEGTNAHSNYDIITHGRFVGVSKDVADQTYGNVRRGAEESNGDARSYDDVEGETSSLVLEQLCTGVSECPETECI
jgi:hypothetical protein